MHSVTTAPSCERASGRTAGSLSRRGSLALAALGLPSLALAAGPLQRAWPRGRATPALELASLDGTRWRLADLRGRVVALNFWASWCEPCRAEMPSLELLAQSAAPQGLEVVAVNYRESAAAIARFVERDALGLPVLRDADGSAARAFGVGVFPTTVLVDRSGRAAFSVVGEADWQAGPARRWVADLLNNPVQRT